MKPIYFSILFSIIGIGAFAQQRQCGFESEENPFNLSSELIVEKAQTRGSKGCCLNACIPVVFHIVRHPDDPFIPDDFILNKINVLNLYFKGMEGAQERVPQEFKSLVGAFPFRFCLASMKGDRSSPAIHRITTDQKRFGLSEDLFDSNKGGSSPYDTDAFLNIWVADCGEFISGFASKPGHEIAGISGVILNPVFFNPKMPAAYSEGKVLVHEIGHYLGLAHTWGNGYGCAIDDGIEDTPLQYGPYFGCPDYPASSCGSSDLFMNYMDYVDDYCMLMFTKNQTEWMTEIAEQIRPGILQNVTSCYEASGGISPFTLYPNPGNEFVYLSKAETNSSNQLAVVVYNNLGQVVFQKTILDGELFPYCVDLSALTPGVYFFRVNFENKQSHSMKYIKLE